MNTLVLRCAGIGALLLLAGCAAGLRPGDSAANRPSVSFKVDAGYQETFRRLRTWAHQCHTGNIWKGAWNIEGNVYTDREGGELDITGNGIVVLRANIEGRGATSQVDAIVWGVGVWDTRELDALRQSVTAGSPTCR